VPPHRRLPELLHPVVLEVTHQASSLAAASSAAPSMSASTSFIPLGREPIGHGASDPAGRAGHDRDLPLQLVHHVLPNGSGL
jgi:hypothetical protein